MDRAHDLRRQFEERSLAALRLGNTGKTVRLSASRDDLEDLAPEGPDVIRAALDLYGAADRDDWQEQPAWRRLDPPTRRRLAEDVRELLLLLAWAQTRQQQSSPESLHEALALLDRAADVRDLEASPAVFRDRATYLEALGRHDEARTARRRPRAPRRPARATTTCWPWTTLGASASAEAVAELDRALALDPRHHWSWCLRGLCHQHLGEHALAIADFSYCLGQEPEAWLHVNRGYSFYVLGQRAEAVRDYDDALRLEPDQPLARWNRGLARLELRQYGDALADLDAAQGGGARWGAVVPQRGDRPGGAGSS